VLLDADLRGIEPIALTQFVSNALERMRRGALRAHLLLLRQIVLNGDARKVLRDRLASAGMLSLVRIDLRSALAAASCFWETEPKYCDLIQRSSSSSNTTRSQ
jgi:hypothetical protein